MLILFAIFALVLHAGKACLSGSDLNGVNQLETTLGLRPVKNAAGYAQTINGCGSPTSYISATADLNCDFSANCKWCNMTASNPSIDTSDWFLFDRVSSPLGSNMLFVPRGLTARPIDVGERVLLAGNMQTTASTAVWQSAAAKCSENPTTLAFTYWMYLAPKLAVLVIDPTTGNVRSTLSTSCTNLTPTNGRCTVNVPAQSQPYSLAIRAYDLSMNFVSIDDIAYTGELGPSCVDQLNFGNVLTAGNVNTAPITTPITVDSHLYCANANTACNWTSTGGTPFVQATQVVNTNVWTAATGSAPPSGNYYQATGYAGSSPARLESAPANCLVGNGVLTFKAWTTSGASMRVCTRDAITDAIIGACTSINAYANSGPFTHTVVGDLTTPYRFVFETTQWSNDASEGMVAIDDLSFSANIQCPATTTVSPNAECIAIKTDFVTEGSASFGKWSPRTANYQTLKMAPIWLTSLVNTGTYNTYLYNKDLHLSLGVLVDQSSPYRVGVLESQSVVFSADRLINFTYRRGTYASKIWLCRNQMPLMQYYGAVYPYHPQSQCDIIAGPALTYAEYVTFSTSGVVVPAGTTKLFVIFEHWDRSIAAKAAFMLDKIEVYNGATTATGLAC